MNPVVTIVDSPRNNLQTVIITRRSENRPCWKEHTSVNLKNIVFRQAGEGQGSTPKLVSAMVDGQMCLFLVQAVVNAKNGATDLCSVLIRLTKGSAGCPETPLVSDFKPLPIANGMGQSARTHTDTLSLSMDKEKLRVFALYTSVGVTRLFCHSFELKNKKYEWLEIGLLPIFNPSTLSADNLLFSASHMVGNGSSLSSRAMLDLRECTATTYTHFGPYTIVTDAQPEVEIRIMDGTGLTVQDDKDMYYQPVSNMYFSVTSSGPVLLTGSEYNFDMTLGGEIFGHDVLGKKVPMPVHGGLGKKMVHLTPQLATDRMKTGHAKMLEFNVQGGEICGHKTKNGKYILVDHVVSGTNRISEVSHNIKSDVLFLSRTNPAIDHSSDLPHLFASSGDIEAVDEINGNIYIRTARRGENYTFNQLWHLEDGQIELVTSLTTDAEAYVFAEHHGVNPFNTGACPKICLNALFNCARLFTCTCAGDNTETNRSADAFIGRKGYLMGNWDLYYMRGSPDPIVDDLSVSAMVVF